MLHAELIEHELQRHPNMHSLSFQLKAIQPYLATLQLMGIDPIIP